jgi:hypothetical protein
MRAVLVAAVSTLIIWVCLANPVHADPKIERCSYERTTAPKLSPKEAEAVLFLSGQALLRRCVPIAEPTARESLEYIGATKVTNGVCRVGSLGEDRRIRTYLARRRERCPPIDSRGWTLVRVTNRDREISDREFLAIDKLLADQCQAVPDFKYGNGKANFRSSCRREAWRAFSSIRAPRRGILDLLRPGEFEVSTHIEFPEATDWDLHVRVDWRGKAHVTGMSLAYV